MTPSRAAWIRGRWPIAVALLAATVALYARVASFHFTFFDDPRYVTENPWVRAGLSAENVRWAFTTLHFSNWHPLTWLSYMLDVQLFGVDPGAMHVVNAVLHGACASVLFLALDRMTGARGRSAFVAVLFAVHPLHVESVAWISERKDVLSTLFGFLGLWAYARHAERPGMWRWLLVTAAFATSLMAKGMWVTFPFLLLLLDYWPLRRIRGLSPPAEGETRGIPRRALASLVLEKVPWLALAAASAALTMLAQSRGGAVSGPGLALRVANAVTSYARYAWMTIWPAGLAAYYPFPREGVSGPLLLVSAAFLVVVSGVALRTLRRQPWIAVGWAWFLGTLVPVIGLVQVGAQAMADRYTYLPSVGLFIAVTWNSHAVADGWLGGIPLRIAAVAASIALAAATFVQTGIWADHVTLFRHAVEVTGPNARARVFLSDGLRRTGRLDEAWAEAREATRIEPLSGRTWMNLGIVELDLGRLAEARAALEQAVRLDPSLAFAWALLGEVHAAQGRPDVGESMLEKAALLAPGDTEILDRLQRVRRHRAATGR